MTFVTPLRTLLYATWEGEGGEGAAEKSPEKKERDGAGVGIKVGEKE